MTAIPSPVSRSRPVNRRRWLLAAAATWLVLAVAVTLAPRLFSRGLVATYYYGPEWSGSPRLVGVEQPDPDNWLQTIGNRLDQRSFSGTWRGWLSVQDASTYQFATSSDDGSWVYIDDRLVVDNADRHPMQERRGQIALAAGLHAIRVDYFQADGQARLFVRWAHGDGPLGPLPGHGLYPTRMAALLTPVVALDLDVATHQQPAYLLATLWSCAMLAAVLAWCVRHVRRHTAACADAPALSVTSAHKAAARPMRRRRVTVVGMRPSATCAALSEWACVGWSPDAGGKLVTVLRPAAAAKPPCLRPAGAARKRVARDVSVRVPSGGLQSAARRLDLRGAGLGGRIQQCEQISGVGQRRHQVCRRTQAQFERAVAQPAQR